MRCRAPCVRCTMMIAESPSYEDDIFLTSEQALDYVNDNTMVIVVDTNKPQMTECPELLRRSRMIAVLDHHRQSGNVIENAVLSYVEPYSSSTCEMVAEVLQYIVDDIKFPSVEADCMYAGIMIDTRNFMNRTGVRTFEAAAFLRRCGADIPGSAEDVPRRHGFLQSKGGGSADGGSLP